MLSRFDGRKAKKLPTYRRIIPFLMRRRNESVVYFDQIVDLHEAAPWIEAFNEQSEERVTIFHVLLAAIAKTIHEWPRMNRFVSGQNIYDRDGVWLSFAVKKSMDEDAPLSTVKREFTAEETFSDLVQSLAGGIKVARSSEKSKVDKEMHLALRLPSPVLGLGLRLLDALDSRNLAPRSLLASDPMYCSAFIANLGSLKMDAAYHHLYERGNSPLFVTVGKVCKRPLVVGDEVRARLSVQLRYSFDERIEDGYYCAQALQRIEALVADPGSWCR